VLAVAVLAAAGCGGQGTADGGLAWDGEPQVFRSKNLPDDRVVIARVRNTGDKTLHLVAADLKVRGADGKPVQATAAFATNFAHGLFGMLQQPNPVPPNELRRLGKVVDIPPDASVPFYAAWRLKAGTREPVRIDWGDGDLDVPEATGTAAGR
jgi:hypothetical protein